MLNLLVFKNIKSGRVNSRLLWGDKGAALLVYAVYIFNTDHVPCFYHISHFAAFTRLSSRAYALLMCLLSAPPFSLSSLSCALHFSFRLHSHLHSTHTWLQREITRFISYWLFLTLARHSVNSPDGQSWAVHESSQVTKSCQIGHTGHITSGRGRSVSPNPSSPANPQRILWYRELLFHTFVLYEQ